MNTGTKELRPFTTPGGSPSDGEYSDEHIALLANALTSRPHQSRRELRSPGPARDKDSLRKRAYALQAALESQAARWREKLDHRSISVRRVCRALAEADYGQLTELGLDLGYAWLDDLVSAAIAGTPNVGIETVGPYAAHHVTESGIETRIEHLPNDEKTGMLLAGAFREVFAECPNIWGLALLDDLTSNIKDRELSQRERDRFVVAMADIFRKFDAIRTDDVPGREYFLIRESELLPSVEELIDRLRACGEGVIETTFDGDVAFYPTDTFIEKLALKSQNRPREFRRRGILLKRQGRPTCPALEAAGFFYPTSRETLNVIMLDRGFESQQDKTYALVRAVGLVTQDLHHNVFYDAERLAPELIIYALCELLAEQVRGFVPSIDRMDDWEQFDPHEYVTRNYGKRILPEDRGILRFVTEQLVEAGIPLGSAKLAADVGSGPNLYPAMTLAPYVADDGAIDLIEYGTANRSYVQEILAQEPDERRGGIWNKFEELLIGVGDDRYLDCLERTCRLGSSIVGSVYSLPRERYDLVSSYFCPDSITSSRREFRQGIRSLASCLKPGGVLITAHMLGSREYHAGEGTHFPAVNLSIDEIAEAYRDADLAFTISSFKENTAKAREGYHGMAVVVARHLRK